MRMCLRNNIKALGRRQPFEMAIYAIKHPV